MYCDLRAGVAADERRVKPGRTTSYLSFQTLGRFAPLSGAAPPPAPATAGLFFHTRPLDSFGTDFPAIAAFFFLLFSCLLPKPSECSACFLVHQHCFKEPDEGRTMFAIRFAIDTAFSSSRTGPSGSSSSSSCVSAEVYRVSSPNNLKRARATH